MVAHRSASDYLATKRLHMTITDKIEKRVTLRAPLSRVWRAIADSQEFGRWFGFELEGPFVPGKGIKGRFTGTFDEAALIARQKSLGVTPSGLRVPEASMLLCTVERVEPE